MEKGHPQRGISVYSYQTLLGKTMTLEDCFLEMYDTGATCFELLTSYIEGYPNPSAKWVDNYWRMCEKYKLQPAELGHWAENHLHRGPGMSDEEMVEELKQDFRLANLLGFKSLRTKITCTNTLCDPEPGWQSYIEKALPYAEKYDVRMQNEVHLPTTLHTPHIRDEYLEFIHRTGTKHFGFNIDFGTFQTRSLPGMPNKWGLDDVSKPEEIVEFLPYSWSCHTKFLEVNENFEEVTIPYKEVIQLMVDNGWSGNLLSEFEGPCRYGAEDSPQKFAEAMDKIPEQVRRHQIMMRNLLGY
ncbi:MAG: sugar phosphate isomerase/epimerase [Oscillospiraceae bacterium]|nr:sugar phosphate isomerase/epimerase [Oscillospiraceae bacterium]